MAAQAPARIENVTLFDVRLIFKNFSGKAGMFNAEGERSFGIALPQDIADNMRALGWPVKELKAREEGDFPQPYISVKVKYTPNSRPPKATLVTSKGKTPLDESLISTIDYADITKADVILRAFNYDFNGNQGVTAYLNSVFVTIREDELDMKYSEVPDANPAPAYTNEPVWGDAEERPF